MTATEHAKKENNAASEEVLKEKYAEFRMAMAQIKQMQEQLEAVEQKKQELEDAQNSVAHIKKAGKGVKMLTPITDGIFVSATLDDSNDVIINIGSDICVKKTVEEASRILGEKQQELINYQEMMLEELNKLTDNANQLESEIGRLVGEEQG